MRRTICLPALLLLLALGTVGCQSGRDNDPMSDEGTANSVRVDREFWYGGWHVQIALAELAPDGRSALVHATFVNLGPHTRRFTAPVALQAGGFSSTTPAPSPLPPTVPGGARLDGDLALAVDGPLDLHSATLTVGNSDRRQAVIPLGSDEGYEPQRPRPLPVTGIVNSGRQPHLTVAPAEIRADNPEGYGQARAGHAYLRLPFTAVNDGPGVFAIVYVFDHHLRVPSGAVLGADVGCGRPQAHPKPYASSADHVVCFEVPEPLAGEYVWLLAGPDTAGLPFTVH